MFWVLVKIGFSLRNRNGTQFDQMFQMSSTSDLYSTEVFYESVTMHNIYCPDH